MLCILSTCCYLLYYLSLYISLLDASIKLLMCFFAWCCYCLNFYFACCYCPLFCNGQGLIFLCLIPYVFFLFDIICLFTWWYIFLGLMSCDYLFDIFSLCLLSLHYTCYLFNAIVASINDVILPIFVFCLLQPLLTCIYYQSLIIWFCLHFTFACCYYTLLAICQLLAHSVKLVAIILLSHIAKHGIDEFIIIIKTGPKAITLVSK